MSVPIFGIVFSSINFKLKIIHRLCFFLHFYFNVLRSFSDIYQKLKMGDVRMILEFFNVQVPQLQLTRESLDNPQVFY